MGGGGAAVAIGEDVGEAVRRPLRAQSDPNTASQKRCSPLLLQVPPEQQPSGADDDRAAGSRRGTRHSESE